MAETFKPNSKTMVVIGASSDIARATAIAFARRGWSIVLSGRDVDALSRDARDLELRAPGAKATVAMLDILDTGSFQAFLSSLPQNTEAVLSAVGLLGEQPRAETDTDHAVLLMRTNFEGPSLLLGLLAQTFEARGRGLIIGISSVAGERGRASNYVYGAAKAGFTAFLSGLRNRLARKGVHVMTVKPGFVRTRMTAGMDLPGALTAEPDEVANLIVKAAEKRRDVVYAKPVWALVMLIIRSIPEAIFKKTKL